MIEIIPNEAVTTRKKWLDKIQLVEGSFVEKSIKIEEDLAKEIAKKGINELINHLRLCGNIPESYGHDTTEEKLYSKYTDCLLSLAYQQIGLKSNVLTERADVADVESYANKYSFVADAKAFRLSRTAKNQKDFKVQAMDKWKYGKPYAMVVCPIYQLPSRNSQIYLQAITRNVCVFTYSHLAVLVKCAEQIGKQQTETLLHRIFKTVGTISPSKSAITYWKALNEIMLDFNTSIEEIWKNEKIAALDAIEIGKYESLTFLAKEREKIMRMSHEEALAALLKSSKIEKKIQKINSVSDNGLLGIK